ncbi:MAG TPA: PQQ-binding-like beta-propeller repeat protein, partial [Blastocatellia bacterium]|nr:PQQ-binding-like beta-propeller repeat protein [Blastocatellia bacterium]
MHKAISIILSSVFALGLPGAERKGAVATAQESARNPGAKAAGSARQESLSEAGATSTSPLALPFKRSWQYLTESASSILPTLDEARIYLPLVGGRAVCLDRDTGSLLWTSEPGGLISAPIAVGESSVYIASRRIAEDGSEAGASLRAVDKGTGLTLWVRDYERRFTSSLALGKDRIYVGSADGSLYALAASSGEPVWKFPTQDVVRGRALVTEGAIYFGSDDGALYSIKPEDAKLLWRVQTGGKIIGRPAIDGPVLYFGSGDGYAYSVDALTGKLRWRSRTGAAIEAAPVVVADRVLVASFDNFIYALAKASGDR